MAEIFVCPFGSIDKASKSALRKAGVVVVETREPERCKFIRANQTLSADDMTWAALSALQFQTGDSAVRQREEFARLVFQIVDANRPKPAEPAPVEEGEHAP